MRRVKGASLLEAVVASVVFLVVFAAAMELLPRMAVRDDDTLLLAQAQYRTERAAAKYGSGLWPCGAYCEAYEWGRIDIVVAAYGEFADIRRIEVRTRIDGSEKRIVFNALAPCQE